MSPTAKVIVRLTEPDFAGSYIVVEQRHDGCLMLQPESVGAVVEEFADRVPAEAEQDEMFRRLDIAADRVTPLAREPAYSVAAKAAREYAKLTPQERFQPRPHRVRRRAPR